MLLDPERAHTLLPHVDPSRSYKGCPVGLRDGAVLALIAAGFSAVEIAALQASAITMAGGHVAVTVQRRSFPFSSVLPVDRGARVLVWLTERRLWGTAEPVFIGVQGQLTPSGVVKILARYSKQQRVRARPKSHRRST